MGHGKLKKFAENATFKCLLQPSAEEVLVRDGSSVPASGSHPALVLRDHPIRGNWNHQMFAAPQPIVLELGCGKGDYTIALSRRDPQYNYIGVDIIGARLWTGAKQATEQSIPNVAFLRTRIEFIDAFFAPGEVSQIWLTFSDPQLSGSENSRLSSPMFLERYRRFMKPGGIIHLKTDSRFLHEYTLAVIRANGLRLLYASTDIYSSLSSRPSPSLSSRPSVASGEISLPPEVTGVQTFYESMFLKMGLPITYLAFTIDHEGPFVSPTDFDADYWRTQEGPRRTFSHQP